MPRSPTMNMTEQSYRLDLECRDHVNHEIKEAVRAYRQGNLGVIALSRTLSPYEHVVGAARPDLALVLIVFVGISSETDALPIGHLREAWHPKTAHLEDHKVEQAETRYRQMATTACDELARLLP